MQAETLSNTTSGASERSSLSWQQSLARAWRDPQALLADLGLDGGLAHDAVGFPFLVTREWAALMQRGDPDDPLLRQVLPQVEEAQAPPGFSLDPVGEFACGSEAGVLRKYAGRALVVATQACAVHCRYCFRRHFPYAEMTARARDWSGVVAELAADPSINEVILSGGDPLTLRDRALAALLHELEQIAHVRRLRIHTRMPVVLPQRVTAELCSLLREARLQVVLVTHVNHAQELGEQATRSLGYLRQAGVILLNQAVLLAKVNDSVADQVALSEGLFMAGVMPYYLHLLDRVAGSAGYLVSDDEAERLWRGVHAELPGYLVPRMVREEAGAVGKTWFSGL